MPLFVQAVAVAVSRSRQDEPPPYRLPSRKPWRFLAASMAAVCSLATGSLHWLLIPPKSLKRLWLLLFLMAAWQILSHRQAASGGVAG